MRDCRLPDRALIAQVNLKNVGLCVPLIVFGAGFDPLNPAAERNGKLGSNERGGIVGNRGHESSPSIGGRTPIVAEPALVGSDRRRGGLSA